MPPREGGIYPEALSKAVAQQDLELCSHPHSSVPPTPPTWPCPCTPPPICLTLSQVGAGIFMHHHPGSFQFREAKVRGVAPGEPGHSTLAEAVELDDRRASWPFNYTVQTGPARRPARKAASWGCLADALIFTPSSGLLEKEGGSK